MAGMRYKSQLKQKPQFVVSQQQATVRGFDGGWNVVDNELNLSPKYSPKLSNILRSPAGTHKLRWGTRLFTNVTGHTTAIVNCFYYNNAIVVVGADGKIARIDGTGTVTDLWNATISAAKVPPVSAWSATTFVCFTVFNNELIIQNGVDKPLLVNSAWLINYLVDIPSGANTHVPVAPYGCVQFQYLVMAGNSSAPSTVYISNKGTSGTWRGDATSDGVNLDIGSFVTRGQPIITGISPYRDRLLVTTLECVVVVQLGVYDSSSGTAVHVPTVVDVLPNYGNVSHRAMINLGDEILFPDIIGVTSIVRAALTATLAPSRPSQLIDPEIQTTMSPLSGTSLVNRIFAVYNQEENQLMWFVPNNDSAGSTTETRGFVYTYIKQLAVKAWSEFNAMNWTSGCVSSSKRLFFTAGTKVYVYGSALDPIYTDLKSDANGGLGNNISFEWQMPWRDFGQRRKIKTLRTIAMETKGTGAFTIKGYFDNWFTRASSPELSLDLVGGDSLGFGDEAFGTDPFGGGRPTADERDYMFPGKCKILKLQITGSTNAPIEFISYSLGYMVGSTKR